MKMKNILISFCIILINSSFSQDASEINIDSLSAVELSVNGQDEFILKVIIDEGLSKQYSADSSIFFTFGSTNEGEDFDIVGFKTWKTGFRPTLHPTITYNIQSNGNHIVLNIDIRRMTIRKRNAFLRHIEESLPVLVQKHQKDFLMLYVDG